MSRDVLLHEASSFGSVFIEGFKSQMPPSLFSQFASVFEKGLGAFAFFNPSPLFWYWNSGRSCWFCEGGKSLAQPESLVKGQQASRFEPSSGIDECIVCYEAFDDINHRKKSYGKYRSETHRWAQKRSINSKKSRVRLLGLQMADRIRDAFHGPWCLEPFNQTSTQAPTRSIEAFSYSSFF